MGLRGRQLVEQRFNWLVIGRQMADMYDGLVDQSAAAAAVAIPRRETDEDLLEADTTRIKLLIGYVPPQRLAGISAIQGLMNE
jgi:hypothetical protein